MPSTTVRISESSHRLLRELARKRRASMQDTLDAAVEAYRKRLFWEEARDGFAALRADTEAWEVEESERRLWDGTFNDGAADE